MLNSDLPFKLIAAGIIEEQATKIPQNGQYTFKIEDENIKSTDIIIATFLMKGYQSIGVSTRCNCGNGIAYMTVYSNQLYTAGIVAGFNYAIIRLT